MIAIDNKLISDQIVEEQFVCDLNKCKGGCCEDGDAGAPLEIEELEELINNYEAIKPYLTPEGIAAIEKQGKYIYDTSFGWVTRIIKCGIEKAYNDGKLNFKKPISCHLFPIRVKQSKQGPDIDYLNYEPRQDLCKAACRLGKKLKVPVYIFLKESIIRKYGKEFYETLAATAEHMHKQHA